LVEADHIVVGFGPRLPVKRRGRSMKPAAASSPPPPPQNSGVLATDLNARIMILIIMMMPCRHQCPSRRALLHVR
jgi:hypothetical protein